MLYIPCHNDGAAHLAIRDISSQYAAATGKLAFGSSQYVVVLGLMLKPRSDATDSTSVPVSYEVDLNGLGDGEPIVGSVRSHAASPAREVKLQSHHLYDNEWNLRHGYYPRSYISRPLLGHPRWHLQTPYFSFRIPDDSSTFEWQIHPSQQGRMRYTLVRRAASDQQQQQVSDSDIQAIYYHIGVGTSLSLSYSEGVLLLPTGQDSVRESLVVASALAMLRRLRELHGGNDKRGTGTKKKSRLGAMKGLFGKE
ncbi:hypothetical protein P168DRAFT_320930 [Aspergillus campestris IBT 28561]|uniref:Uncharacterized protein n=1 Tax=Aspergillus campestris (strain IBT 28561) TaxID=1392248 RepID=A0A2I1CXR0_ASPC2|nr:uncharacterized protein P168DRAFT_320930 [Aspergillus campestris IBT 28561]PKY02391.1 hypothetical protein P168DRAFT_320930 [Aspergillus campestris IBT 28561]